MVVIKGGGGGGKGGNLDRLVNFCRGGEKGVVQAFDYIGMYSTKIEKRPTVFGGVFFFFTFWTTTTTR